MLGAIAGDVIGSADEAKAVKTTDFQLFSTGTKMLSKKLSLWTQKQAK